MTADELLALGSACGSPSAAEAFLSKLGPLRPGTPTLKSKRFGYFVESKGPFVEGASRTDLEETHENLGVLMAIAGFGKELRKLRKLHETTPPSADRMRVPSERWVVAGEAINPLEHPDVQALACLRLVYPNTALRSSPWIALLAYQRLRRLIVTYPALLHPSILWDTSSRSDPGRQILPMAQTLALAPRWEFPGVHHGFTRQQIKMFATHPAVAAGLKGRAPAIEGQRKSLGQAVTLCELVGQFSKGRLALTASILRLDRVRHTALGGPGLLGTTETGKDGLRDQLARCFTTSWTQPPTQATEVTARFLFEFRSSPTVPTASARQACLRSAAQLFAEPGRVPGGTAATTLPTPDPVERFERLLGRLVETGLAETRKMAGHMTLRELLPLAGEPGSISTALGYASIDTANRFANTWLELGVDFPEMKSRFAYSQGGEGSPWCAAISIIDTHRSMSEIIARSTFEAGNAEEAPRRRRREAI